MRKQVNRRLEVTSTPHVSVVGSEIRIESRGYPGSNTTYTVRGDLSPYCAARLCREIRRALRELRDTKSRYYNTAVENAEGSL